MKQKLMVFCFLAVCLLLPTQLFSQIDNLSNMSPDWIRLANRNAATDGVDIVIYNPAGLTKLADGFHIGLGNQSLSRKPEHSFNLGMGRETYTQDGIDPFIPNLYFAYKKNNWSIFGGVYIPGGGAVANYPEGSITTKLLGFGVLQAYQGAYGAFADDSLEASSIYLTTTLGGAYAFNDTISVSAALRYINAKNNVQGGLTLTYPTIPGMVPETLELDADLTASGVGAIFGVNYSPNERLNIGMRYETKVKLDFETDVNTDNFGGMIVVDGEKNRRDFPALFGIGVSYQLSPKLRGELNFSYCFQKQADWGTVLTMEGPQGYSDLAGDCYGIGGGLAYTVSPKLELSCGVLYTVLDFQDIDTYYTNLGTFEVLYTDNFFLGTGLKFHVSKSLSFTAAGALILWESKDIKALAAYPMDITVETKNISYGMSFGIDVLL